MAKRKTAKRTTKSKARAAVKSNARKLKITPALTEAVLIALAESDRKVFKQKLQALKEDFPTFFTLGTFDQGDPALAGFRRFSKRAISTDLDDARQDRQYVTAVTLWHKSPIARYFVDLKTAFLTTGERKINAKETAVADWIQQWLSDPLMSWEDRRVLYARESVLAGELLPYPHVNPETGHVRRGYVSPAYIKGKPAPLEGFPDIADVIQLRKRALVELGVIKGDVDRAALHELSQLKVIMPRILKDPKNPKTKKPERGKVERLDGDIFFIPFNRLISSLRGHSLLLTSADQIDAVDEALFAMIERLYVLNLFCWHIVLEGKTEAQIEEWRRRNLQNDTIHPGSMLITNEKGKVTGVNVPFNNADFVVGFDKALNVSAMSFGIPQAWLGLGDLVNRASAEVSETPIMKLMQQGRQQFRNAERMFIQYHVLQGQLHGSLPGVKDHSFEMTYEELSKHDQTDAASAFSTLAGSVSVAIADQLMTRDQAKRLLNFVASQIVKLPEDKLETDPSADPNKTSTEPEDFEDTLGQNGGARSDQRADAVVDRMAVEIEEALKTKRKKRKPASRYKT